MWRCEECATTTILLPLAALPHGGIEFHAVANVSLQEFDESDDSSPAVFIWFSYYFSFLFLFAFLWLSSQVRDRSTLGRVAPSLPPSFLLIWIPAGIDMQMKQWLQMPWNFSSLRVPLLSSCHFPVEWLRWIDSESRRNQIVGMTPW